MTPVGEHVAAFRSSLLDWYRSEARPLPWRESRDPYRIWISEIMLQQTRVEQAMPYYERFLEAFPDVGALADADVDDVLRLWEGLGYYSRARNLHKAAQVVADVHGGRFPDEPAMVRELPGVGAYTTAAVVSMAFGGPLAAVDGNVSRVIARVFAIEEDIKSGTTRRQVQEIAQELLDPGAPGDFNQAMMELGARVCRPKNPDCEVCPLRSVCLARMHEMTDLLPFTPPRKPTPRYDIAVGVIRDVDGRVLAIQRPHEGLLGGLWEFPGGKVGDGESPDSACRRLIEEKLGLDVRPASLLIRFDHQYSHFGITVHAFECGLLNGSVIRNTEIRHRWARVKDLRDLAMHKSARRVSEAVQAWSDRSSMPTREE